MAKVYSNATITIAAVSSKNCHAGLYRTETTAFHAHELSPTVSPNENMCWHRERIDAEPISTYQVIAQTRTTQWYDKTESLLPWDEVPPLANRAWFFQEWQLSPRMLHFDFGELVWQCNYGFFSQWNASIDDDFLSRLDSPIDTSLDIPLDSPLASPLGASLDSSLDSPLDSPLDTPLDTSMGMFESSLILIPKYQIPGHFLLNNWQSTVRRYSKLDLTFHRDKLMAISGVVKCTRQFHRGDTYAAGLWREAMPWDLAWRVRGDTRSAKPDVFAAPSWSWASVQDQVEYFLSPSSEQSRLHCVVHDITCVPEGNDPTGALRSASMTISGLECPSELEYDDVSPSSDVKAGIYRLFAYDANKIHKKVVESFNPDYALYRPGKDHIAPNTPLRCLWITVVGRLWVGLVLSRSRHVPDAYERIGIVNDRGVRASKLPRSTFIIV